MHDNRETALANAALMINCEHVSVKQTVYWGPSMRKTDIPSPRRWWVHGSDRLNQPPASSPGTVGARTVFGQERTTPDLVLFVAGDMHEHLGQLIAYARTNQIVPPWSR